MVKRPLALGETFLLGISTWKRTGAKSDKRKPGETRLAGLGAGRCRAYICFDQFYSEQQGCAWGVHSEGVLPFYTWRLRPVGARWVKWHSIAMFRCCRPSSSIFNHQSRLDMRSRER